VSGALADLDEPKEVGVVQQPHEGDLLVHSRGKLGRPIKTGFLDGLDRNVMATLSMLRKFDLPGGAPRYVAEMNILPDHRRPC
jgi:hypothetical protein